VVLLTGFLVPMAGGSPALAADCVDGDGDLYVVCDGCDLLPGMVCNECDDANPDCWIDCTDDDADGYCVLADCDDSNASCTTDCTNVDGDALCAAADCDDHDPRCTTDCLDGDGDGYCQPEDCDDSDPFCSTSCADQDLDGRCPGAAGCVWQRTFGRGFGRWIEPTPDGGFLVAGYTKSAASEPYYGWILKLDMQGRLEWERAVGGGVNDHLWTVHPTSDGGLVVPLQSYTGQAHISLVKLNRFQLVDWQRDLNGPRAEQAFAVDETHDGGVVVAGNVITDQFNPSTSQDMRVWKLLADGSTEFQRYFGGAGYDRANAVRQTRRGTYLVAGFTTSFGAGGADVWSLTLNELGALGGGIQKTIGGPGEEWAWDVRETADEGSVVAGFTNSFGAGGRDVWVLRLDRLGNVLWQKTYGGVGEDEARAVVPTHDGGFVVAATTDSFGAGQEDFWVLRLDADGNVLWQHTYGSTGIDRAESIAQTQDGEFVVVGTTSSFAPGGIWVVKLDAQGNTCGFQGNTGISGVPSTAVPQDTARATWSSSYPVDELTVQNVPVGVVPAESCALSCEYHDCDDLDAGCVAECADADADGLQVCSGDCNDSNPHCLVDCSDQDGDLWCVNVDCDDTAPACTEDCTDADLDGHAACADDCDDADGTTYPDAPEVNDGLDNQCPGDDGHGLVDEISGDGGFHVSADPGAYCWPAQSGATLYVVARSTAADFSIDCTLFFRPDTCVLDAEVPPAGGAFHYVVQALVPNQGSWGRDGSGAERVIPCSP
jgi:hypothetical protein